MEARSNREQNLYLAAPTRTLYDACHRLGRDDGGRQCPSCPVLYLCDAQEVRWVPPRSSPLNRATSEIAPDRDRVRPANLKLGAAQIGRVDNDSCGVVLQAKRRRDYNEDESNPGQHRKGSYNEDSSLPR
jgi:hypothetical protein